MERGQTGASLVLAPESEPNEELESAQRLLVPGGVKGTLGVASAGDKDCFGFEMPAANLVAIRLSAVPDADLVLHLLDGAGKTLHSSDNGPKRVAEGFPNLLLQPGSYRLVVREFVPRPKRQGKPSPVTPRAAASSPYHLEVVLLPTPAPDEELEPNDEAKTAGTVAIGGTASGYLGWRNDRDLWKVPVAARGEDMALAVEVDGVGRVTLKVAVLDGAEGLLLERRGQPDEALALRNVAIQPGQPHYFVAVSGNRGNLEERYTLRVTAAPFRLDEEEEPNDSIAKAGALSEIADADEGTRVGYLGSGDVDVYRLEPAAELRSFHVTALPPPGLEIELSILDASGQLLAPSTGSVRRGAPAKQDRVAIPAGAPAFLRLAAKTGDGSGDRYTLRWSAEAQAAPSDDLPDEPDDP